MLRPIILDRDDTIVVDKGYLSDPDGLQFLPGAASGLRRLHERGHRLIVISNQSGVGRGLCTSAQLEAMNQRLSTMVEAAGARLTGIYCCPHRPDEDCECRKPRNALLMRAAREHGFNPADAIVVGDKGSDIALGKSVGATTILITAEGRHPVSPASRSDESPDYQACDLQAVCDIAERLSR